MLALTAWYHIILNITLSSINNLILKIAILIDYILYFQFVKGNTNLSLRNIKVLSLFRVCIWLCKVLRSMRWKHNILFDLGLALLLWWFTLRSRRAFNWIYQVGWVWIFIIFLDFDVFVVNIKNELFLYFLWSNIVSHELFIIDSFYIIGWCGYCKEYTIFWVACIRCHAVGFFCIFISCFYLIIILYYLVYYWLLKLRFLFLGFLILLNYLGIIKLID